MKKNTVGKIVGSVFVMSASMAQAVPVIAYEWTEGGPGSGVNSQHVSRHGVRGPVLADDFKSVVTGRITQIDWWGSGPIAGFPNPDLWEITFHTDAGRIPAATAPTGGVSQHFVNTNGDGDPDGDGVHMYSASWTPQDLIISSGVTYWFSVANDQCTQPGPAPGPGCLAGWTWALAGGGGPTVGTEMFNPVRSIGIGPNGGPHFGPWNVADANNDFAFRIWVEEVPEPATLALMGLGLAGIGYKRSRKIQKA